MRHGSCVHALSPFSVMRPDSWLMAHASCVMRHASCVMRHASCVMRHASCVMRPLTWHASTHVACVMRHASTHVACVMRPASGVMAHASCVMRHASCVMRHASIQQYSAVPFSPPAWRRGISHRLDPLGQCPINALNFAPLRYMERGNRVVLPPPYSPMARN